MLSTLIPLVMLLVPAGSPARPPAAAPLTVQQDTLRAQDTLQVKEEKPGYQAQAKITGEAAKRTALGRVPGGHVESAELEKEKGHLVYSFDIVSPSKSGVEEVQVDALSGKVISHHHESAAAEAKEHAAEAPDHH
jgi:uncharacterized membrane protein YkoI